MSKPPKLERRLINAIASFTPRIGPSRRRPAHRHSHAPVPRRHGSKPRRTRATRLPVGLVRPPARSAAGSSIDQLGLAGPGLVQVLFLDAAIAADVARERRDFRDRRCRRRASCASFFASRGGARWNLGVQPRSYCHRRVRWNPPRVAGARTRIRPCEPSAWWYPPPARVCTPPPRGRHLSPENNHATME